VGGSVSLHSRPPATASGEFVTYGQHFVALAAATGAKGTKRSRGHYPATSKPRLPYLTAVGLRRPLRARPAAGARAYTRS
jgi:hypothetical protein